MSENEGTEGTEGTGAEGSGTEPTDWQAEAEKWKAHARKHEERAKVGAAATKELERLKAATMSETEKAVAEAEQRGATAAAAKVGARLARAELKAAAAGRIDPATLDGFLEFADLARFVGEDGEPDAKAIEAAINKLGGGKPANFDGGARTTAGRPADMNSIIRRAAGVG